MSKVITNLLIIAAVLLVPAFAFAEGAAAAGSNNGGLIGIGIGLAVGLAAFGSASGQGRAVASAMESIGRNPNSADKIFTPMIVGLALMESITIFAFVVAVILQGKI